jgi:hypothetical protein
LPRLTSIVFIDPGHETRPGTAKQPDQFGDHGGEHDDQLIVRLSQSPWSLLLSQDQGFDGDWFRQSVSLCDPGR